jgi:hypothetical protein
MGIMDNKICSYVIPVADYSLLNLWLNDGRDRLKQLYFRCRPIDVCCGMQCCPPATQVITTVVNTSTVTDNGGAAQPAPVDGVDNAQPLPVQPSTVTRTTNTTTTTVQQSAVPGIGK